MNVIEFAILFLYLFLLVVDVVFVVVIAAPIGKRIVKSVYLLSRFAPMFNKQSTIIDITPLTFSEFTKYLQKEQQQSLALLLLMLLLLPRLYAYRNKYIHLYISACMCI